MVPKFLTEEAGMEQDKTIAGAREEEIEEDEGG
jgi:hypothetical protein